MIATEPDRSLTEGFGQVGGSGKPRYGQLAICYDTDREAARKFWHWDLSSVALPSPSLTLPVAFWPAFPPYPLHSSCCLLFIGGGPGSGGLRDPGGTFGGDG